MVQKAASGQKEKASKNFKELVGFMQNEIADNGQMRGCRWLHPRAVRRGYAVSQHTIRQLMFDVVSLTHVHKAFYRAALAVCLT